MVLVSFIFDNCFSLERQLILRKDLVAIDGQQKNVSYKSLEIGAIIRIGDVGQPNISVPLGMIEERTEIRRSIAESASLMLLFLSLNKVTQSPKQIRAVSTVVIK